MYPQIITDTVFRHPVNILFFKAENSLVIGEVIPTIRIILSLSEQEASRPLSMHLENWSGYVTHLGEVGHLSK